MLAKPSFVTRRVQDWEQAEKAGQEQLGRGENGVVRGVIRFLSGRFHLGN